MYRLRIISCVTTIAVTLLYSVFIAAAQSIPGEKETKVELPKLETLPVPKPETPKIEIYGVSTKKKEKTELDERPTFDLSLPRDNKTQSLALFFERPFNSKSLEGKISGNYFLTFQKQEIPHEKSVWEALRGSFTGWEFLSRSYAYRLEGSTTDKFGVGGYIELERDVTIETDPHLHTTLYGEYIPLSFVEVAIGGWAEILRLGKKTTRKRKIPIRLPHTL